MLLEFTWDPRKDEANQVLRGFGFHMAAKIFAGRTIRRKDTRHDYGEDRYVAIGAADGWILTVVYCDRVIGGAPVRRIISARRSKTRERRLYEEEAETGEDGC